MVGCQSFNCTTAPWNLQANPDISGVGVLVGFGASAYLTLFFCATYYFLDQENVSNPVDRLCLQVFWAFWSQKGSRLSRKWTQALQSAVLTFSDQQSITGIAILVSGYSQLACGLAIYHWQVTVDLAWFSSITHLTTLTCLRHYFHRRPVLSIWRLLLMGITVAMLACAIGSTGFLGIQTFSLSYPAWCLLHPNLMEEPGDRKSQFGDLYYNSLYIAITLSFLVVSYGTRLVQLFPTGCDWTRSTLRATPSNLFKRMLSMLRDKIIRSQRNSSKIFWVLTYKLVLSVYCLLEATADLYGSVLWEITWLLAALVWGTTRILADRDHDLKYAEGNPSAPFGHANLDVALAEQNVWGYGQVITVALLILPLIPFFEVIYETMIISEMPRLQAGSPYSLYETPCGPSQSYEDFYKYPWFHKIHLLMYLLSLTVIGEILYFISYSAPKSTASYTATFSDLAGKYALWIGFNVALVWIYTLLCVVLLKTVEAKHMDEWQSMEEAQDVEELLSLDWTRHLHTGTKSPRLTSLICYGMVLVLVSCSILFDKVHREDKVKVL